MAPTAAQHFDRVIRQFQAAFEQVAVDRDEKPTRARLEMIGTHGPYRVRLVEILTPDTGRGYAYYVLRGDNVIIGFDNSADPRALRLKYGADYTHHRLEQVPHCHTDNKTALALTEEMDCERFIAWVQANLPLDRPGA
jgi:hypothetical protein